MYPIKVFLARPLPRKWLWRELRLYRQIRSYLLSFMTLRVSRVNLACPSVTTWSCRVRTAWETRAVN